MTESNEVQFESSFDCEIVFQPYVFCLNDNVVRRFVSRQCASLTCVCVSKSSTVVLVWRVCISCTKIPTHLRFEPPAG